MFRGFWPVMARAFPSSAAALGGIHLVEVAFADFDRRKLAEEKDHVLVQKHTFGGGKLRAEPTTEISRHFTAVGVGSNDRNS